MLIAMHFLPWVHIAGNQRKSTLAATTVFLFLFTICSSLQPFNGTWSPNKLVFKQEYNAGDALATVTVFTGTGAKSILKAALPAHEFNSMQCEAYKKYLTRCTYETDLLPKYGSNATLEELEVSAVFKVCDDVKCKSTASYKSKNSLMCRVYFDPIENQLIQHAWVNDKEITGSNISALLSYIDQYQQEVTFSVEYPVTEKALIATLSCFYDEWTHNEVPAFTALRSNLPEKAVLLIRGQGLALVNYRNITL